MKAWVNIMYGCDKFCTYCIVPYTRGKERSRRPEDVIDEMRDLARQGFKEITLARTKRERLRQRFDDIDYRFGDLMDDIRKIDIPRVRFTTCHPRDFDDHLIEVLAKRGNLVEHIHLPVQSGSNANLETDGAQIYAGTIFDLVRKIEKRSPDVVLDDGHHRRIPGRNRRAI